MTNRRVDVEVVHRRGADQGALLPPLGREFAQLFFSYALTVFLFSWIFPPPSLWPLALVCLVPWIVATCRTRRAWLVHWGSFLFGGVFFLVNLRWLMPVTGKGFVALAFYLALYWPLSAWAVRTAWRHGIQPVWTVPVAWVACEYLRAWVMSGFPWLLLGHAFSAQLSWIQIADLGGAYAVTFVAALVNGCLATILLRRAKTRPPGTRAWQLWAGVAATAAVLVVTLAYGAYRLREARFERGPRVAVVQHSFELRSTEPYGEKPWVILAEYLRLAADAAAERPDLLVFPETVWGSTQNIGFLSVEQNVLEGLPAETWNYGKLCHEALAAFARGDYRTVNLRLRDMERRYGGQLPRLPEPGLPVTLVVGSTSIETSPGSVYPKWERFNSALIYDRDGTQRAERYDKIHLVPFGEIVPFRHGRWHWLYRWLNALSPFSEGGTTEYSLTPGRELRVFELAGQAEPARFGTPICYEDVMPYLIRDYVWEGGRRRVDFLVSISNDAWFGHGPELPQHLAICAFRAVENRVGIARAVNTGISGFIDPNGRIYSVVERDGRRYGAGVIGYRVDHVQLDSRRSPYGRIGDAFARACLALTAALWGVAIVQRWILAFQQRLARWKGARNARDGDVS